MQWRHDRKRRKKGWKKLRNIIANKMKKKWKTKMSDKYSEGERKCREKRKKCPPGRAKPVAVGEGRSGWGKENWMVKIWFSFKDSEKCSHLIYHRNIFLVLHVSFVISNDCSFNVINSANHSLKMTNNTGRMKQLAKKK